jgi:hypothetical protein
MRLPSLIHRRRRSGVSLATSYGDRSDDNHGERERLQHQVLSVRCWSMSMLGRSLMVWS